MAMPDIPRIMDEDELARLLKVTRRTVQRWRGDGRISCHKLGKKAFYTDEDLVVALLSRPVAGSAA